MKSISRTITIVVVQNSDTMSDNVWEE